MKIFPFFTIFIMMCFLYWFGLIVSLYSEHMTTSIVEKIDEKTDDGIESADEIPFPMFDNFEESGDDSLNHLLFESTNDKQAIEEKKKHEVQKEDILLFIEEDKERIIYRNNMYEVFYYPKYKINKVWLNNPFLSNVIYNDFLRNFGIVSNNRYNTYKYPYSVAMTRLYAGLGEFDKNFAHLSFMKDDILSINNLYFRGDFKGSDELINDINHKALETQVQVEYKVYDFDINTLFLSADSDRTDVNIQWDFISIDLAWKYLYIGYANNKVTFENDELSNVESIFYGGIQFKNDTTKLSVYSQNSSIKKKDEIMLGTKFSNSSYKYSVEAEILFYNESNKLDGYNDLKVKLLPSLDLLSDVFYSDYVNENANITERSRYKLGLEYRKGKQFVNIMVGNKTFYENRRSESIEESFFTLTSQLNINIPLWNFNVSMKNSFEYDKITKYFYYVPEYSNTSDISIVSLMSNNNKWVILGCRMYLLSNVFTESLSLIHSDPVYDLYTSISISKQFDLSIELNNINRNYNYGNNELQDFHFTSYLVWYFLN